jgi:hypothetical protein
LLVSNALGDVSPSNLDGRDCCLDDNLDAQDCSLADIRLNIRRTKLCLDIFDFSDVVCG